MKQLSDEAYDAVLTWLDQFELSKPARGKTLGRDFSDGVLLAQILKQLYPKIVELHNYPPRNSFTLKLDNWNTLNRKVLRKLNLTLAPDTLTQLCNAVPGVLERVCHDIMLKHRADEGITYDDDTSSENTDVMSVNVSKRALNGSVQQVVQKMVTYTLYEKSQTTVYEQQQAITILTQKIEHLDNLLKLKCQRIEDLLAQLARKPPAGACRLKVKSELTLNQQRQSLLDIGVMVDKNADPMTMISSPRAGGIRGYCGGNGGGGSKSDGADSTRSLIY